MKGHKSRNVPLDVPLDAANHGFTARELNVNRQLIEFHYEVIIEAWHEHCG